MTGTDDTPTHTPPGPLGRWILARLLAGKLPAPLARRARRRLDDDEGWAAYYDEQRKLERALEAGAPLSANQRAGIRAAVLGELADAGADEVAHAPRRWRWVGASAAGLAATAALLVVFFGPLAQAPGDERWQPRGSDATVGVKARCVDPASGRVLAEAAAGNKAPLKAPALTCPRSAAVALAATNTGERGLHYAVVGIGPAGDVRYLEPFARDASAATVPAGTVDDLPEVAATLADLPAEERLALFVVFRDAPFSVRELADAAARARRAGVSLRALSRLPLDSVVQARIDLTLSR